MTKPRLKKVMINGIDVSSYVMSFAVEDMFGKDFKTSSIGLKKTVSAVLNYNDDTLVSQSVTIQRGVSSSTETYLFRGTVSNIAFQGPFVIVKCEDNLSEAKVKTINYSFDINNDSEAGVISELFKTLINDYTSMTADNTSVQNSGTVFVRKKFVMRRATIYDGLKQLAENIDWQFYYDPEDDLVYFEPKGFVSSSTVFNTSTNIVSVPKWEIDSTNLFNKIIVKGVQQEVVTDEGPYQLNGVAQSDWTTSNIFMDNKPVQIKIFCDTSNPPTTEKVAGKEEASSLFDYSVDNEDKKVEWSSTFNPTTSYYALAQYSFMIPTPVERKNAASIALYTNPDGSPIERSVFKDDLKNVEDVAAWAQKQVNTYGFPFYIATLKVKNEPTLRAGRVHRVIDNVNSVDKELMIHKIVYSYPYHYDNVSVGDKTLRTSDWGSNPLQRLKRLEEKQSDNEDIFNRFVDVEGTIAVRNVAEIYTASPDSGVLYFDDDNQGTWGNDAGSTGYNWGTDVDETQTLSQRNQSNNIYFEDFWDEDLVDASTTATVSTTSHNITFGSSGADLLTDLLHYYKFDTDADDCHGSNDGTVTGASLTTGSGGKINEAYTFDGNDDYITLNSGIGSFSNGVSIAAWIDVNANNDYFLYSDNTGTNAVLSLGLNTPTGKVGLYDGTWREWTYTMETGAYHYVVFVFGTGTSVELFVDNVSKGSITYSGTFDMSGTVQISYTGTNAINGDLDEIAFYDDVLDSDQLTALWNSGNGLSYDSFTSGGGTDFVSEIIFKNKTTNILNAKLSINRDQITETTGLTYSMRVDGINWESATLGSILTFSNSGTQLEYKIVGGTGDVISFVDTYGRSVPLKIEVNI